MGGAARTVAETIVKKVVTIRGGEEIALARTPASAAPATNLLWDLGGTR